MYRLKMFCNALFLLIAVCIYSQELPPLEIFTPQEYGGDNQNWSITQGVDETIYIANNRGLLEYNGAKWKLYSTKNQTKIRSIAVIDEKIFTGSYMDFGYWERDDYGALLYNSLAVNLDEKLIEDEEIWQIIPLEDWILFQSLDRIYIYNSISGKFKIIESDTRITKMYKVDETIYFQKINKGIYKIENGNAVLVTNDTRLLTNEVVNIFEYDQDLLIQTREKGFYIFTNAGVLSEWDISAKNVLSNTSIYSSIRLLDGTFILGTISKGIIRLDALGNVLFQMDQSLGLSNNTVLSIFEDILGNIWLGLDNGVNSLNLQSPYRLYRDKQGVLGTVYAATKKDDFLYLGTNQGLFFKILGSSNKFNLIPGTNGQVWSLQFIDGILFCGHDKGTFEISGKNARKISDENGAWNIKKIEGRPDLLIQGNYKGLNILQKLPQKGWTHRNKIEGFDISSRYFEFVNSKELLVSHEYKGVYRLELNADYTAVKNYSKQVVSKGVKSSLVKYKNDILYAFEDGVYSYDNSKKEFIENELLISFFEENNYVSGKLIKDANSDKLWGFFKNQIVYLEPGKLTDVPKVSSIPLPSGLRKSKSGFEAVLNLDNDKYLLGTTEGYLVIDLNQFTKKDYKIKINSVHYSRLQDQPKSLKLNEAAVLKTNDNNLHFSFSVSDFDKLSPSLYQYKLLGIYNDWSVWSEQSDVLFENLPHGEYVFEVRAKVGEYLSTNTINYNFTIERPWYSKPLAFVLYIIVFLILLFLLHFFNRRYYKKQKKQLILKKERELEIKELENQKRLMQFKNQNLSQDIENKNRELGLSTMNLIRKNELLNTLKKELSTIEKNKDLNRIITIIDKNINNTEDWKLFEEAFNNADKDFIKKIKEAHPTLTPNDLKLCTYLRLNLSSKEIAPLLNISPRSVEVKRYRLRKKMELPHEASLTNYILEI